MDENQTDDTRCQVEPVKSKRQLPPALAANIRRGNGAGRGAGHGGPAKGPGWGGPAKGVGGGDAKAPAFAKGNRVAAKSG